MKKPVVAAILLLVIAGHARAQEPICVIDGVRVPPSVCVPPRPGQEDPLMRLLFSPELVMAHQQAINLNDRQRSAIQGAMKEAQSTVVDVQFKMSGEVEKLVRLLQATTVDEAKVLDQVDRVLNVEREMKHAQLSLMVRIKNQLSAEQQAALDKLRRQE